LGGGAVGGPAGVADADGGVQRIAAEHLLQRADLAGRAAALDPAVHDARDARGVVAAVLQPLEAFDEPFLDGSRPDDADDAAHVGGGALCAKAQAWTAACNASAVPSAKLPSTKARIPFLSRTLPRW